MFFALLFVGFCATPMIIPAPVELTVLDGEWELTESSMIGYDSSIPDSKDLADFVAGELKKATGFTLSVVDQAVASGIYFGKSDHITKESEYQMTMNSWVVSIYACSRSGLFYGFQTLLQLLPKEIYSQSQVSKQWKAQCVDVYDYPRFEWRGIMIDSARHFFDVETIKLTLDACSHFKINMAHLHLTDDQGWRIEMKKYPNITQYGSVRDSSPRHWYSFLSDGTQYGPFYYSEEELLDIIEYARLREITIVPELEMPGHSLSFLSAYPQFSCTGGPFKPKCEWGIEKDVWCAGNDDAIAFLEDLLDEIMRIFPSKYIHVGGDECPKNRWYYCEKCQKRIKDQGLADEDELESWFIEHFAQYLISKGRSCIGWDEIMKGKLPDGAAIMSWEGTEAGEEAAEKGHNVVMTPTSYCYFDYAQFPASDDYEYISGSTNTLYNTYSFDPSNGISEDHKKYVIGAQGNLWSEYIWERTDLHFKAFPRMIALAELTWTPLEKKNWERFLYSYTQSGLERLHEMGIKPSPVQLGTKGEWFQGDFPKSKWVSAQWDLTGSAGSLGQYEVAFFHKGGDALHIRNVNLYFSGVSVASDEHESVISEESYSSIYSLYTVLPHLFGAVSLTAEVKCENSTDCSGELYLYYY